MKPNLIPFAALVALITTGCIDNPTFRTPVPSKVSVPVKADEGGEVRAGDATLTIPPGALAEDTVITLEVVEPEDTDENDVVKGKIFKFGPEGLQFNSPATLSLDVQAGAFTSPGAITKYNPNLGLWDEFGPTGSEYNPNLGLWDQTGDSGSDYNPNLGLWDQGDPNKMATGVTGFSSFATTLPTHGVYSCGVDEAGVPCWWGLRVTDCTDCAPEAVPVPTSSDFVAVAPGAWSDCGLKGDGTIQCWGANPPVPPTTGGFIQVAMGRGHACALNDIGTITCFMAEGRNYEVGSPSGSDFVAVTAGDFHACALRFTGEVTCWGPARDGEADAPGGTGFYQLDAGARHTCAVTTAGEIQCWGSEISGINNVPATTSQRSFVEVSVGVFAACGLTSVGGVVCWGADYDVVTGTPSETGYTRVIARHRHACAVRDNGSFECWGQNIEGSLTPPAGCGFPVGSPPQCEIGFIQGEMGCVDVNECLEPEICGLNATCTNMPGGYECACDEGFTGDGITCTADIPADTTGLLATGNLHNCAIRSGQIWCWGLNDYGQLGDGSDIASASPVQVGRANDWVKVASGGDHNCAINAAGELWCWGANFGGALGNGTFDPSSVPVQESTGAANWTQVTVGGGHTCALNTSGEIFCWGDGVYGQLGDGMIEMQSADPKRESSNATNWATVEAGADHTCALDDMGNLYCWGSNFSGQLGNGMMDVGTAVATQIGGGPWDKVALGIGHTCATRSGELWCWGSDIGGQLGVGGGPEMDLAVPTRVGTDTNWETPIAGGENSCGLKSDGSLWCWGSNFEGQLGVGDTNSRNTPVQVGTDTDWTSAEISLIGAHSCGLKAGQVVCWGANLDGQLGVESSRLAPAGEIETGAIWSSISAFGGSDVPFSLGLSSYGCGIKSGAPWCWGWSAYTSLTDSAKDVPGTSGNTDWSIVSSRSTHSCGLQNGAPRCWGDNTDGGLGNASNTASSSPVVVEGTATDTDWTKVSAGSGFSCGIQSGALWCWGRGLEGQLGDGQQSSQNLPFESGANTGTLWSVVSAGHTHVCGIQSDSLYCWGGNAFGQLGNGSTSMEPVVPAMPTVLSTSFTEVAAGEQHSCAIDVAGNLLCTGDNTYGELGDGTVSPSNSFIEVGATQAPWSAVSVGRDHTCGVASGMAYCWGANQYGQLGDGTINDATAPVAVSTTFTDWVEISVGDVFTCGRRTGGESYCWGDNGQGQMGDGSARFLTPRLVALP